jgi:LPPG:FO 2-phospho-L-lactate transferase
MYTLAGVNNPVQGWGRAGETWNFMTALEHLGGEHWFRLGDRDLAVHVLRSMALARGVTLAAVTRTLCAQFGVRHSVLPMSDDAVRTRVRTAAGELAFQDYFVRRRCRPRVTGFRYAGSRKAAAPSALQRILRSGKVRGVIVCPSNPYVSIAPILSVPEVRDWLKRRMFPVVAVSPIVGGKALKGPAAKMMREVGREAGALGIAQHYGDWVDGWVIDERDAAEQRAIERAGRAVIVTDTIMRDRRGSARLARRVLSFTHALAAKTG